jgi:conjugative transfer region lipoprotein (TIGR03751 family)
MRMITTLMLLTSLISLLSACSTNVVPQTGPTMEQVYDSMPKRNENVTGSYTKQKMLPTMLTKNTNFVSELPRNSVDREFHKLPNPELKMYVFPHLSGKEEVPVPGYTTAFSAYSHDYYVLPIEMVRE